MNFNELSDKDKKKLVKQFNNYLKENEKLDRLEKEKKIAEKQQLQITKYLSNKKNRDSAFLDSLESSMFYDDNNNHIQFIKDNYNEEYQLFINDLNTIKNIYNKYK